MGAVASMDAARAKTSPQRLRVASSVRSHCRALKLSGVMEPAAIDVGLNYLDKGYSEAYAIGAGKQSAERFALRQHHGKGSPHPHNPSPSAA